VHDEVVNWEVQWDAFAALGQFADARVMPDLERIAQEDKDINVRWAAQQAIDQIRQRASRPEGS
jgi:HEAT repeat protein